MRLGWADHLTVTPAMALIVALACAPAGANAAGAPTGASAVGAPTEASAVGASTGGQTTGAAPARAIAPRTTLPVIERQVMCATCKIPLNVAESPQADRERAFIRNLIARGQTEAQIKSALVAQYGPAVLALPSPKGFDLAAYLVPAAVVFVLFALLALLLPRWRRQARAQARAASGAPELSASDAARLDADLERFD